LARDYSTYRLLSRTISTQDSQLLSSYISRVTRKRSFSLEFDRDIFWYNKPKKQEACPRIIKQEMDYADPVDKDNIYNNPLQEIPEYICLGDNSGLDNNNFEYLLVLKYFLSGQKPLKLRWKIIYLRNQILSG
jgi:hypothetical protein